MVEFPAGGAADVVVRRVAGKLRERINQQVVIDNRPGAGGVIAHEHVAKSPADGYTLLLATTALAANKSLHRKLPYDAATDFAGISLLADWGAILVVHPSVPAKTLGELMRAAKARDGQMTYSSAGNGTWPHLATEMLLHRANVKMIHVPYKGAAPALTDVIGGFIDAKLESNTAASVKDRDVNARLIDDGVRPAGSSAADQDKLLRDELALWAKVIKEVGIKAGE